MSRRTQENLIALAFLAVFIGVIVMSLDYGPRARMIPLTTCVSPMIATAAVHLKKEPDTAILAWLPLIEAHATDGRNFVKKAVNWALRQIGKRNLALREKAMETAAEIQKLNSKPARWIAADALRELRNPKTEARIRARAQARTPGTKRNTRELSER